MNVTDSALIHSPIIILADEPETRPQRRTRLRPTGFAQVVLSALVTLLTLAVSLATAFVLAPFVALVAVVGAAGALWSTRSRQRRKN